MKLGMITCNYYSEIYNYNCPASFNWGDMVTKHMEEYNLSKLRELAKKIKSLGIDAIEIWAPHASYILHKPSYAKKAQEIVAGEGLSIPAYCIAGWSKVDIPIMDDAYAFAAALGANVITGTISETDTHDTLAALDSLGEKYGIRYAVENHPKPSLSSPEQIFELISQHSEWVGANIDSGIYSREGFDVAETARIFGKRIYHVHFKDSGKDSHSTALGEGITDLAGMYAQLKTQGYQGMISIEHEPQHDPTAELIRSINWCRNTLKL